MITGDCSWLIGVWATGLWTSLGGPPNVSALTISGFAVQTNTIGTLNSYIGTCYHPSGYSGPGTVPYAVVPCLGPAELAIIGNMYLVSYYTNLATATMGYGGDSIPWTNLAEGDSKISRGNPAAIGLVYINQSKEAQKNLNYMVAAYIVEIQQGNIPRDVETYNYWPAGAWSASWVGS